MKTTTKEESLPDFTPATDRFIRLFEQILDMNNRILAALEQIGYVPMIVKLPPNKEGE